MTERAGNPLGLKILKGSMFHLRHLPQHDVVVAAPRERSVELRALPHAEDDPREVAQVCRQGVVKLRVGAAGHSGVTWTAVNATPVDSNASSTPPPPPCEQPSAPPSEAAAAA